MDERSAALNIPNERTVIMRADHMNMCKFASSTEERYVELRDELQELVRNAVSAWGEEVREERRMMKCTY